MEWSSALPDATFLARLQFAFTVSFHILFPAFTIGLAGFIATLEVASFTTGHAWLHHLARFWTRIFAVCFAMGVVSGIVLSYQFGTNWSEFSLVAGNVIGPAIAYEVLTAFFLEATFLGIMLFGEGRVPRLLHVLACVMVALGTMLSAFWIISANSWMHTPDGHAMAGGIAWPVDWLRVIFNPSFPYRLAHMLNAAYLTTSLVVLATGAHYLRRGLWRKEARTMLRMGLGMVALLAPLQLAIGDLHGLNTAIHQPAKLAAIEGHWDGSQAAPLILFAIPDTTRETNRLEIGIPGLGSLFVTHQLAGLFPGLRDFAPDERPPVVIVFYAFRIMVGIGVLLIALGLSGAWLWWRGRLFDSPRWLRLANYTWPLGFCAMLAGWIVTECGRQPWVVTGILRTTDAVSPVPAPAVATSLLLFILIYTIVFLMGGRYVFIMLQRGPAFPALLPGEHPSPESAPGAPVATNPAAQDPEAAGAALANRPLAATHTHPSAPSSQARDQGPESHTTPDPS